VTSTNIERILITGATGRLGKPLSVAVAARTECVRTGLHGGTDGQGEFLSTDLTRREEAVKLLEHVRPDAIIHCAALTDVELCETMPERAFFLNVQATRHLTNWCLSHAPQTKFIYISTDQLYDGPGPHHEEEASPINVYGLTKLWGEDLAHRLPQGLIVRTNFVGLAGAERGGFADWLVEGLKDGAALTLFEDVLFNPLHVDDLCEILIQLLERNTSGTLNIGCAGRGVSKADFGLMVAKALGFDCSNINRTKSSQSNLVARRPHDMRMSVARAETTLARQMPTIERGIDGLKKDIAANYRSNPKMRS
jgi:dTDP-4-dehydrorhamnose reductase